MNAGLAGLLVPKEDTITSLRRNAQSWGTVEAEEKARRGRGIRSNFYPLISGQGHIPRVVRMESFAIAVTGER